MAITHIHERIKLAALLKQSGELWDEKLKALAPLEAAYTAKCEEARCEYVAAGGSTGPHNLAWLKDAKQQRLDRECWEKTEPAHAAIRAVHKAFTPRERAIRDAIDAIEKAIGAEAVSDPCYTCHTHCALTGLPLLTCDRAAMVLIEALPATAAARQQGESALPSEAFALPRNGSPWEV